MKSRPTRFQMIVAVVAIGAAALAAYPGYNWWIEHRTANFEAECQAASDEQDWNRLADVAGQWTEWDPTAGKGWVFLASAAQELSDIPKAADALDRVPDHDPLCVPALVHRVELLFQELNDPRAAVATCQRILKIDPLMAVARQRLIFFYAQTLQRQKMSHQIREAIDCRREPPEAYVYLFGTDWLRFTNGYATNSRWLETSPDDERFEIARAVHLAAMDDQSKSPFAPTAGESPGDESLIEQCADKYPSNPEVLAFQAQQAVTEGDADRLAELLGRLPADAADDNRFWRYKGWFHASQNEHEAAEDAYRQALQINPYDWRARHELAGVLRQRGNIDEADHVASLAAEGKDLARRFQELVDPSQAPAEILLELMRHADACGDDQVVKGLRYRLGISAETSS